MNFRLNVLCLVFVTIFGVVSSLRAQGFALPSISYKETYVAFDDLMGMENQEIYNGVEYIEKHRMLNEKHKFFLSFDFQKGTVFYDGQPYFNVDMKYNVVDDVLLVQFQKSGAKNVFQLSTSRLDGFSLKGKHFINLSGSQELPTEGILEVIFDSSEDKILKKHHMKEQKILEGKLLHYEFEADASEYFFVTDDRIFKMNSKNLLNRFPDEKGKIKRFFRKQGKNLDHISDADLTSFYKELLKDGNLE